MSASDQLDAEIAPDRAGSPDQRLERHGTFPGARNRSEAARLAHDTSAQLPVDFSYRVPVAIQAPAPCLDLSDEPDQDLLGGPFGVISAFCSSY